MADHSVKITITADASKASKAFDTVKKEMQSIGSMKVSGKGLDNLSSAASRATAQLGKVKSAESSLSSTKVGTAGLDRLATEAGNATGEIRKTEGALGMLSSGLSKLGGIVAGAFAVGSIAAFGKSALEAAASAEVLRKGLTFQLGADEADKLISKMKAMGETTAYDGSALIPMARQWINVGNDADTAVSKMEKIVDVGSAFGLTQEQIGNCTLALTQMEGAGKIDAANMNQLTNDGIPAWKLLSDAMGLPVTQLRDMAAKGELTGDAMNALWTGMEAQTKGAAASMQGTLMSTFTNLEESAENSLAGIGQLLSSLFDVQGLGQSLGAFVDGFKESINNINESIAGGGDPVTAILDEITQVSPVAGAVANTVVAAVSTVKDALSGIATVISKNKTLVENLAVGFGAFAGTVATLNAISTAMTAVKTAIASGQVALMLLSNAWKTVQIAAALANAVMLANPIVLAVAAIVAAIALIVYNWDMVKATAEACWEAVTSAASAFVSWIGGAFAPVVETISSAWDSVKAGASAAWESVSEGIDSVLQVISDLIISYINIYVAAFSLLYDGIVSLLSPLAESFETEVMEPIEEAMQSLSDSAEEIWQEICAALDTAFQTMSEAASAALTAIAAFFAPVLAAAEAVWEGICQGFESAWEAVSGVWGTVSNWFETTVWSPIASAVETAETAITSAFQSAYDTVTGIFSGLAGWFEDNVVAPIRSAFSRLADIGSSITGLRTSSGGSSLFGEYEGGINGGPMRLARGGMVGGQIPALANGGKADGGTIARIGEAGPEAVIPLKDTVLAKIGEAMAKATSMKNVTDKDKTDAEKAESSAKDLLDQMKDAVADETATKYEAALDKLAQDIADKKTKIADFEKQGASADTIKALNAEAEKYSDTLTDKVMKDQQDALTKFALEAKQTYAEAAHDYAAQADAQYEIAKNQLEKERADKERELMLDQNDTATKTAIAMDYYAKLRQAEEKRMDALRKAHQQELGYMQENGDLAGIIADAGKNGGAYDDESRLSAMKDLSARFIANAKTLHKGFASWAAEITSELQDQMESSLESFIEGTKSASEAFSDFGKSILKTMAKIAAQRLAASWTNSLISGISGMFHFKDGGKVQGYAGGGCISGQGTSRSDSIPALLSDGEFVMNAAAVKKYGPILDEMNANRFADGGAVAPTLSTFGGLSTTSGKPSPVGGVVVNITNKTGDEVSVKDSSFDESMQKWVLDIVIDGASRNRSGFGSNLKSALNGVM